MIDPTDLGAPEKFASWRPHQFESVMAGVDSAERFVGHAAPTGSGKSLMGITHAIIAGGRAAYLTSTKALQGQLLCVGPDTKILDGHLRYRAAKTIQVGDVLLGFDEMPSGKRRLYRPSIVVGRAVRRARCYRLTMEDGTSVVCTYDHPWLVKKSGRGRHWLQSSSLRIGGRFASSMSRLLDVWDSEQSYRNGYLVAAFDGEGCLSQHNYYDNRRRDMQAQAVALSFCQSNNGMRQLVYQLLDELRIPYRVKEIRPNFETICVSKRRNILRVLGETQPPRLLGRLDLNRLGMIGPVRNVRVVGREEIGEQEVVSLQTTTGTYIAEGFASHNCDFGPIGLIDIRGQSSYQCVAAPDFGIEEMITVEEGPCHGGLVCPLRSGGCLYYDQVARAKAANLVVTNYKLWMSMYKYSDGLGDFDLLILDEAHNCFVAGTQVGGRPIETIRVGDMVWAFNEGACRMERARVTKTYASRPGALVKVCLWDGSYLVCTPEHPFYTSAGWVEARQLGGKEILKHETWDRIWRKSESKLRLVWTQHASRRKGRAVARQESSPGILLPGTWRIWEGEERGGRTTAAHSNGSVFPVWCRDSFARLPKFVLQAVWEGVLWASMQERSYGPYAARAGEDGKTKACGIRTYETKESNAQHHQRAKDATEVARAHIPGAGRQWDNYGPAEVVGTGSRGGNGICYSNPYRKGAFPESTEPLQGRHSNAVGDVSSRSRRKDTFVEEVEIPRPQEDRSIKFVRVDRVEVLEQGSDGTFGGLCPGGLVYNIEVGRLHTYTADGFIVHNCQDEISDFLTVVLDMNDTLRFLGCRLPRFVDVGEWKSWAAHHQQRLEARVDALASKIRALREGGEKLSRGMAREMKCMRTLLRSLSELAMARGSWVVEWILPDKRVAFSPLWPADYTEDVLFLKVPKVLLLSATLVRETMGILGVKKFDFFESPCTFSVESRPVYWIPTVGLSYRSSDEDLRYWLSRIDEIMGGRLDRKGIIHAVSYRLAKFIAENSKHKRILLTHDPRNTRSTVEAFKQMRPPVYMVSPSLTTGWDFEGDSSRVNIIAKLPFPDMRSTVLRARMEAHPDYLDYMVAQTIVQMAGRSTRSEADWSESFVIDDNFGRFLKHRRKLFPSWFLDACRTEKYVPKAPPLDRAVFAGV